MAAAPDHVAVRLVAEHGDVAPAHDVGDALQVVLCRDAAGGVVRRVQEDGSRRGIVVEEPLDVGSCRPEAVRLAQRCQHGARAAALDVRQVRRKIRAEDEHAVAGIQERLAEELLEHLGAGAGHDVARLGRDGEFLADELRRRRAKLGDTRRRTVVRLVVLDRLHAARACRCRAVERAVADLELDDVLAGRLESARHCEDGERRLDGQ